MKKSIILFAMFALFSNVSKASTCNWQARKPYFMGWDSCAKNQTLYGYIYFANFTNAGCLKYTWFVNGAKVATTRPMNYKMTSNGTYVMTLKVTDTCNQCDTTFSKTFNITCFNSTCNWQARKPYFMGWDSCAKNQTLYGYIYFANFTNAGCLKYTWSVNGAKVATTRPMNYKMTSNGTYVMTLKVTDTCNQCDTTFSKTFNITCFNSTCNWQARKPYFMGWDSCAKNQTLYGYIYFANFTNAGCLKYTWSVNGAKVATTRPMNYKMTSNGTYVITLKVTDTCNQCDTTFSKTFNITCFNSTCNWQARKPYFMGWDSCAKNQTLYGYIYFANFTNAGCLKYTWSVNGAKVATTRPMNYKMTSNGTYVMTLKVTDTCNQCDTTFSKTFNITCFGTADIKGIERSNLLLIAPNPTEGVSNIQWNGEKSEFHLCNLNGQIVKSGFISNGKQNINWEVQKGIYLFIVNGESRIIQKIIIE